MPMPRPALARAITTLTAAAFAACGSGGSSPPPSSGVTVQPPFATVPVAGEQAFVASPTMVEWRVREGDAGGVISATGLYTAPAAPGTYTVVAVEPSSGASAEASVTVVADTATLTHGLYVPATHPRLWYDSVRLARARTWYAANPFTPDSNSAEILAIQRATRGLLNVGNPADQQTQCRAAVDWAMAQAAYLTTAGWGETGRNSARWWGEGIILAFDWCHAYMTPAERATFVADANVWIQHWQNEAYAQPPMHQNNYYWGWVRNSIEWAIASHGENDPAVVESLLDNALVSRLQDNFDVLVSDPGVSKGGVLQEGTSYGPYVAGYSVVPYASAGLLGRPLREETNFWKEAVYAFIYQTTPQPTPHSGGNVAYRFFPSGDLANEAQYRATAIDTGNFMNDAAVRWASSAVGQHARQWLDMVSPTRAPHVASVDPGGAALPFSTLPLDYYASGMRYLWGRSSWDPAATAFFFQMGDRATGLDYVGHVQADWGSWQLWRGGRWLARETPGYSDTDRITGYGGAGTVGTAFQIAHNSLLINGEPTSPCIFGGANGCTSSAQGIFSMTGDVAVPRLESRPGYTYAVADLRTTFRPTIRPEWRAWVREYLFVRGLETLVIFDRVESASANATKTFLSHCETNPALTSQPGTGYPIATCTNGAQQLVMTSLVPAASTHRVVAEGGGLGQYRIEAVTSPGTAQSYVLTVLQAKDASAPALSPSVVDGGTSYTVTLAPGTSVTFQKGMTSSGGTITLGGSASSLRADVQPMVVTNAGPAWQ